MSRVVLLGPQRGAQTVGATLQDLSIVGPVATITAGWQEWEGEDERLQRDLGGRGVNLRLYERADAVWDAAPDLLAAHRAVQDRLKQSRQLYNRRLAHLATAWLELLDDAGPEEALAPERAHALEAVRSLDTHHLARIRDILGAFEADVEPFAHEAVAAHRSEIRTTLDDCGALVIEGGHVALLYNRLRLFGIADMIGDRPVIACSGGAMALAERIVLFHDDPPWGPGHTEVAVTGLGIYRGLLPLPDAHARLRLDDAPRVRRLVERLAPDACVPLEAGTRLDWDGVEWTPLSAERLEADGGVRRWAA